MCRHISYNVKGTWNLHRGSLVAAIIAAAVVLLLTGTGAIERWELWTHDVRLHVRGHRNPVTKIVLVDIDDDTLSAWPEPMDAWGWRYEKVIQKAFDGGASVVGLDVAPSMQADKYIADVARMMLEEVDKDPAELEQRLTALYRRPELQPDTAFLRTIQRNRDRIVLSRSLNGAVAPRTRVHARDDRICKQTQTGGCGRQNYGGSLPWSQLLCISACLNSSTTFMENSATNRRK